MAERKLQDFSDGQKVTINEYLGHLNVPATVIDASERLRKSSRPTLTLQLEVDAGHSRGTIIYYFENELDRIVPREGDLSK